jgi:hypothetical protein
MLGKMKLSIVQIVKSKYYFGTHKFPRKDCVTAKYGKNIFWYSSKRVQLTDPVDTILSFLTYVRLKREIKREKIIRLNFDEFPFHRCYKEIRKRQLTKTNIKHVVIMLLKILVGSHDVTILLLIRIYKWTQNVTYNHNFEMNLSISKLFRSPFRNSARHYSCDLSVVYGNDCWGWLTWVSKTRKDIMLTLSNNSNSSTY